MERPSPKTQDVNWTYISLRCLHGYYTLNSPYYFDLFLTSWSKSFKDTQFVETGLPDFEENEHNSLKTVLYKTKS